MVSLSKMSVNSYLRRNLSAPRVFSRCKATPSWSTRTAIKLNTRLEHTTMMKRCWNPVKKSGLTMKKQLRTCSWRKFCLSTHPDHLLLSNNTQNQSCPNRLVLLTRQHRLLVSQWRALSISSNWQNTVRQVMSRFNQFTTQCKWKIAEMRRTSKRQKNLQQTSTARSHQSRLTK